jgi:hypothetical protein
MISANAYQRRRSRYFYPAVVLRRRGTPWSGISFRSTAAHETHARRLLTSPLRAKAVLGYLSVIYWGNYASQSGKSNRKLAIARVNLALPHLNTSAKELAVAHALWAAFELIKRQRYGDALWLLTAVPRLGPAFASKVCALMAPDCCGVIDSVIAARYRRFKFTLSGRYVAKTRVNAARYQSYCCTLQKTARRLNNLGPQLRWRDWDGAPHSWRAIDVERALYAK